jgi:chaperonin GroES
MSAKAPKLKPIGEYILVEPVEEEEKTASGLILQTSGKGERPQKGKIVALGTGRKDDNGKVIQFSVEAGQTVIFKRYSPEDIELEGNKYLLMKESDILAVIS